MNEEQPLHVPLKSERLSQRVMLPLFSIVAIDAMGMGVVLPLLPFYSQRFGANPLAIGALVAVFSLCQFIAAPWLGRLSDRYGRKPVLLYSQIGTFLGLILLASAGSLAVVFLARIIDGITSGNLSVASAYAVDHSTPKTRRQAIGMIGAAIGVGMMVGPSLSAGLVHISITAPVWGAAFLSGLSVLGNLVLLENDTRPLQASAKLATPSFWQTLKIPETASVLAVLAVFYLGFSMFVSQFALFMQARYIWHGMAFGPREVGYVFTASGAINICVQLLAVKRIGRFASEHMVTISSFLLIALGFGLFTVLPGIGPLIAGLLISSFGTALARPALLTALSTTAAQNQQGTIMGANSSLMAICNVCAPLFAGLLIEHRQYIGWGASITAIMMAGAGCAWVLIMLRKWPQGKSTDPLAGKAPI